ncbi:unnamed protein product [Gongylonema pulchrum]|uniref:GST_C domain-containing protein n=1 Tax=Gongylonema pulchrum TaxID=637853 RepID=A0A183EGT2_9BILA|nr:unnamed protein product [Gongylonema pulchrum]
MPPFKSSFCPSAIKLTGGCAEENFLKYLAVLGARAGEDCVTVVDDGITVTGRVSAWKLLGSVVGAYPAAGAQGDANIATHIDRWLVLIEQALSKGAEDGLSRQMSSALSGQDYLVPGATGATLADILAYSVISNQIYYANNVELWLRRMHKLFN